MPSDKIVMGMPLYGRSFANTTGIGKPFQGVGEGSWEQGVWDFKALPQPGAQEHLDEEAGASYSYDNNTKSFVTYDTLPMALRKAHYIKQKHLGGAMWWELSGDRQDNGSIITNVRIPKQPTTTALFLLSRLPATPPASLARRGRCVSVLRSQTFVQT